MKQTPQNPPNGWRKEKLGQLVADTQLGGDYPSELAQEGTPLVKMINIGRGVIINCDKVERIDTSVEVAPRDYLQHGDLLLNTRNSLDLVGKVALWKSEIQGAAFNNNLMRIEFKQSAGLLNEYANLWFNSHDGIRQLRRIAIGTTSVAAIYWRDLASLKLCLPPQHEQSKIADILTTWDEALTQLDALIEAQERRKKALMQQLLTGRRRLKGFSKPWKHKRLDAVFERVDRAIEGEPEHVLSITAGRGFVDQREKFSRVIAGRNIENYVLLKKGEFSYNKGNSDRYPQGCVYRLEEFEEGAVPNVWISFRLRADTDSPLFYKHFFLYGGLNHGLHRLINAGVRNDGLLNLTASNFFSVTVPAPEPAEQAKLGGLFENLSISIKNLRDQRTALDQQKRGLMQRLLTGVIRVKP